MLRQWRRISRTVSWIAGVRKSMRGALGEDSGATVVETAISVSIVLMLLFAVFDFSLAFYTYHYVSDAAREGSRWAIVRGSLSCKNTPNLADCGATAGEVAAYVKGLGYPGINAANYMTVSVSTAASSSTTTSNGTGTTVWNTISNDMTYDAPGDQVTVQVSYAFPLSVPFWKQTTLNVSSTSSMVFSQ